MTLEGDVADPAGTMSGGSQKSGPGVLTRLAELHAARDGGREREADARAGRGGRRRARGRG